MSQNVIPQHISIVIGQPKRTVWLSLDLIRAIKASPALNVKIDGPNGKGKYKVQLMNTAANQSLFSSSFTWETEEAAENAMRDLLEQVKDLLV